MINKDFTLEHSITILNNIVRNSTIHYDSSDDSVLFFQILLTSITRRITFPHIMHSFTAGITA